MGFDQWLDIISTVIFYSLFVDKFNQLRRFMKGSLVPTDNIFLRDTYSLLFVYCIMGLVSTMLIVFK